MSVERGNLEGLSDLIARLEKATKGSRELDERIAWLLSGPPNASGGYAVPKPFTTSLDAALTLVPSNGAYYLQGPVAGIAHVILGDGREFEASASTVPLALCMAALEARKSEKPLMQGAVDNP